MIIKLRNTLIVLLVGICLGIWWGFNLGRDEPMLSNPFEEKSLADDITDTIDKGVDEIKDRL